MFGLFNKNYKPTPLSTTQLKKHTRVLIIDDEQPTELRELLTKDGWKNYYLNDLDSLTNKKLKESHVICIDIMGVGQKLQVTNGLELVKYIKEKYPEKKVILYSSISKQDIFSDALDYVDKRLRKESSLIPFSTAIQEMAEKTLSWDETIKHAYLKIKEQIDIEMDYETFKLHAEKSFGKKGWDKDSFIKKSGVGLDVASKLAALISLVVAG